LDALCFEGGNILHELNGRTIVMRAHADGVRHSGVVASFNEQLRGFNEEPDASKIFKDRLANQNEPRIANCA
jgi:hypothetical protein